MWSAGRNPGSSTSIDNGLFEKNKRQKTNSSAASASASASASANSSSQSLPIGDYEVFLNFRGPDTRDEITGILHHFLVKLQIRTFKDDDDLRKGESIWPNLVKAIQESKIYVPVFSETYAYSKWCLKELAKIVEHQEKNGECIILPIFYMVDPSDVRHQSGPYQMAFQQHEQKNVDKETIGTWKEALSKVGALDGWHVKSKNEKIATADLVCSSVWSHLMKSHLVIETGKLFGIDDHIKLVMDKMSLDSGGATVLGIHGTGGIGKTTVATAVYNKLCTQFGRCSFLDDVREKMKENDGIISLQKKLISDISRVDIFERFSNVSQGVRIIKDRISQVKALIVLDDVDEGFKFENILGKIEDFISGTRFIITSRDKYVLLKVTEESRLYEVQEMSHPLALQLFCYHAFRNDSPSSGYEKLSEDVVSTTGRLPLALEITGSSLFGREKAFWVDKLARLREIPEKDVVNRLKISFDTLDEEAKDIFLDIACFFIGEDKEIASYMWRDCKLYPGTYIQILVERSMIKIGDQNQLHMHDQLKYMGREVVRQENTRLPWDISRIWSREIALGLLRNKKGTDRVEGIRIHQDSYMEELGVSKECFMKLSQLRYLDINARMLIDDFNNYVPNLRWLRLKMIDGGWMPKFSVEHLVILEVSSFMSCVRYKLGTLRHIKMASNLKVLKLSGHWLHEFPEFPRSGSLEILELENRYHSPSEKDRDIDWADKGEKELDIGNLGNLKVLRLRDGGVREITCETIRMMPLENRKVLHLLPSSLTTLHIIGCSQLKWLPNLENLETLIDFSIKDCPFVKEILGLGGLKSLETLSISGLKDLRNLDGLDSIYSLKSLSLICCFALERLPSMASLSKLLDLSISSCSHLTEIQGLGGLGSLQMLFIQGANSLSRLFGFETLLSLNKLGSLEIRYCPLLTLLPFHGLDSECPSEAPVLNSLRRLFVSETTGPVLQIFCRMIQLLMFPNLTVLVLIGDEIGITDTELQLDGLESMEELVKLHLYNLRSIRRLPSLSMLVNLESLAVINLPNLQEIEGLAGLKSLEELCLIKCTSLERLPADQLYGLEQLKKLKVKNVPRLRLMEGLAGLKSLKELSLIKCTSLERLPADQLYGLEQLKMVDIYGCTNLTLTDLSALRELEPRVMIEWPNSISIHNDPFEDSNDTWFVKSGYFV